MSDPRVTGLRNVDLAVYDLAQSAQFYKDHWALSEVSRNGDSALMRATGEEHHVVALHQRPRAGIISVTFAAPDKAAVDGLHAKALGVGAAVASAPHALDAAAGGGYGFELSSPEGQVLRISSDVAAHADVTQDAAKPSRINHVVLNAARMDDQMRFFCDVLGFKFSDFNGHMNFIRCSRNHHSIALAQSEGASLNHVAFEMENFDGLMSGVGRMRMGEHEVGWGVGRHAGPGQNIFSYFVDPNGYAIEYTTEVDQVDDTYVSHDGSYWTARPLRPCSWAGRKTVPTDWMHHAMAGKTIEERNAQLAAGNCDDVISEKMAS
ncbi:MAG: glyoxalase/bleomycin resistance protein/dioxygenase [Hyphomicrobiales bacterium]|nr:glyoxalase/bleomycin resistance protein/dioxygenase [Hyphomicrobiales bacterium]